MGFGVKRCLQRGRPACPYLYEESWTVAVPKYVLVPEIVGTAMTQYVHKVLIGYDERLHIGLHGCLLGEGHEKGHLIDMHSGSRWRVSDIEDDEQETA
jgi:hypothetical protein